MVYLKIAFSLCGASESIVCCLAAYFESHSPFVFIFTFSHQLISCARDRHITGVDVEAAVIVAIDFRESVDAVSMAIAHFNLNSLHTGIMSRCFVYFFHFSLWPSVSLYVTQHHRGWMMGQNKLVGKKKLRNVKSDCVLFIYRVTHKLCSMFFVCASAASRHSLFATVNYSTGTTVVGV